MNGFHTDILKKKRYDMKQQRVEDVNSTDNKH